MVITILVFLLILSVLVLIHEFGHFIVARWSGIGVEEFALGLPFTPPIFSKKLKDGLKLSVYPLLFGGFVKLLGEDETSPTTPKKKNGLRGVKYFFEVNVWKRIAVVVAGVFMNLVLAVGIFYIFLSVSGWKILVPRLADYNFLSPARDEVAVIVTYVFPDTPAQKAGLVPGDVILAADDKKFSSLVDFQKYAKDQAVGGKELKLTLSDTTLTKSRQAKLMPRKEPPKGQGSMGIGIGEAVILDFENDKLTSGVFYSLDSFIYNLVVFRSMIDVAVKTGDVSIVGEGVSGPVGIGNAVGAILGLGGLATVVNLLNLVGLLSLSLAFMNLLPIPAMDGGRLVFLLIEALSGKKFPAKWEARIHQVGMVLLLGLMFLITYLDIAKVFKK